MGIKLLDKNLINKIAAGEVVERPSSVVKELVENSIDAKSTAITVEIKDGGTKLIRITDNGSGIPEGEVEIAFKRHATSKISEEKDLNSIFSLGFRGEALASISAVTQLEMMTKTQNEMIGTRIEIHGGEIKTKEEVGVPNGTTLIMKNLFYNTPARLEFLKSTSSEAAAISEIMDKLAMTHPEIAFKYINNGKVILHTNGNNNLKNVIYNIYGKEISGKLIPIEFETDIIKCRGFIGKPEVNRASRKYENIFINGRYIKSDLISRAVEDAYKTFIIINKFPFFTLHFDIDPSIVDVNVHPTKMEVRFSSEADIYETLKKQVYDALSKEILIPEVKLIKDIDFNKVASKNKYEYKEAFEVKNTFEDKKESFTIDKKEEVKKDDVTYFEKPKKEVVQEIIQETFETETKKKVIDYKIIGQMFDTYWIVEQDSKMYIIDQHAAHEKVMYEKIIKQFKKQKIASQTLVTPVTVELSNDEMIVLKENINIFRSFGFDVEEFGTNTYIIREIPIMFNKPANGVFFMEILDEIMSGSIKNIYDTKEDAIATISCKAAVKGNDRLSHIESRNLIEELFKLDNPYTCPHGRPTIISMTKYEVEKKFKRIQ